MDSKTLNQRLGEALNVEPKQVESMLDALAKVIAESAETTANVTIPSFGTFGPVKYNEEIKPDETTGKDMIFPPKIELEFQPAASLRLKLQKS